MGLRWGLRWLCSGGSLCPLLQCDPSQGCPCGFVGHPPHSVWGCRSPTAPMSSDRAGAARCWQWQGSPHGRRVSRAGVGAGRSLPAAFPGPAGVGAGGCEGFPGNGPAEGRKIHQGARKGTRAWHGTGSQSWCAQPGLGAHLGAQDPRTACAQPAATAGCRTPQTGCAKPWEREEHRIPTKQEGTAEGTELGTQDPQTARVHLSSAQHCPNPSAAAAANPIPTAAPLWGRRGFCWEICTPRPGLGTAPSLCPAPSWAALADELPGNEFCTRRSRFPPPCLDKCRSAAGPGQRRPWGQSPRRLGKIFNWNQ